jgi:hypothetical protein
MIKIFQLSLELTAAKIREESSTFGYMHINQNKSLALSLLFSSLL